MDLENVLRRELWVDLENLGTQMTGPWPIMDNFNCVLNAGEILGNLVNLAEIKNF